MKNQANILAYERQRLFVFGGLAAFFGQANGDDTIEDVFLLSRFSRLVLGKFWSRYGEQRVVSRTRPEFKKSSAEQLEFLRDIDLGQRWRSPCSLKRC